MPVFGELGEYTISQAGRRLRQQAIAEGKRICFTRAAIGEGRPDENTNVDTMTDLVLHAKDVILKKSYLIDGDNHLHVVRIDNAGYTDDVLMSELAVIAKLEDQEEEDAIQYGYAYIPEGYRRIIKQTSETSHRVFEIVLDTKISLTREIELQYDSTGIFVSHADLDDFEKTLQNDIVRVTGDQVIEGNKTFTENVVIPLSPTEEDHAVSKAYTDSALAVHTSLIEGLTAQIELLKDIVLSDIQDNQRVYLTGEGLENFRLNNGVHNTTAKRLEC